MSAPTAIRTANFQQDFPVPFQEWRMWAEARLEALPGDGSGTGDVSSSGTRTVGNLTKWVAGVAAVSANGDVTFGSNPADGDVIALNGVGFTYRNSLSGAYEIQRGISAAATCLNTITKLNASSDPLITVATYSSGGGGVMHVVYDTPGAAGNTYSFSASGVAITFTNATLTDGADAIAPPLANATPGTDYLTPTGSGTGLTGVALLASANTFTAAQTVKINDGVTTTTSDVTVLGHNSTGTPVAGFGGGLLFNLKSDTVVDRNAGRIAAIWTRVSDSTRGSALVFQTVNNGGSLAEVARFAANGDASFTGQIKAGTTPVTLTDTAGKILSAALNTVAVAQGGTGQVSFTTNAVLYGSGTSAIAALAVNASGTNKFLTQSSSGTPAWNTIVAGDLPGSFAGFANPSASVGLTAVNGSAATAMRSDGAPALSQAISPTWTGAHSFTQFTQINRGSVGVGIPVVSSTAETSLSVGLDISSGTTKIMQGGYFFARAEGTTVLSGTLTGSGPTAVNRMVGLHAQAWADDAATVPWVIGLVAQGSNHNSTIPGGVTTIDSLAAIWADADVPRKVNTAYGILVTASNGWQATNAYGIRINSVAGAIAGQTWGIYDASGWPSWFASDVHIIGQIIAGTTPVTITTAAGKLVLSALDTSSIGANKVIKTNSSGVLSASLATDDGSAFYVYSPSGHSALSITDPVANLSGPIVTLDANNAGLETGAGLALVGSLSLSQMGDTAGSGNSTLFSIDDVNNIMTVTAFAFMPSANDGTRLGNTNKSWSDLFLADGAVINFNNGDVTLTHSTNALAFGGAGSGYSFDANVLIGASTANLYLKDTSTGWQSASSTVITPQSNNSIRSTSYTSGLLGWNISAGGNAEFNNIDVRGAIHAGVFVYNALQVTAGTQLITPSGAKLKSDVTVPASPTYTTTTVTIDAVDQDGLSHAASQLFAVNDIIELKDGLIGLTWFKVTAVSDQTTFWRYTASIQAGTANVTYRAGLGIADYKQANAGFIVLTADQTNAPYIQMATHDATFSSANSSGTLNITPKMRAGNLNGSYGYGSDVYGFGTGQYGATNSSWITVDQTSGLRIGRNTTQLAQWDVSGNILIGQASTASQSSIYISSGAIDLRNGGSNTIRIHLASDGSGYLANSLIAWDTSGNLTVTGNATIAGWTVNSTYFAKDTGTNATSSGMAPADYSFFAGATYANRAGAPFRVTPAGVITATSGTIGGWTLASSSLTGSNLVLDAGGEIYAGATSILAGNGWYLDYNSGTPRVRVGTVSAGALVKGMYWDGSNMIIQGTNFTLNSSGNITATGGTIAGWTLAANSFTSGTGSTTVGVDSGGTNPAFYAGSATPSSAPFRVTNAGALTATNATITGTITATAGAIGGWTVGTSRISSTHVFLDNTGEYLSMGTTPPTSYGNNVGVYLEGTNSGRMSLYKDADNFLQWTSSVLSMAGSLRLSGSASNIAIGSTPPTSTTAGTGLWIDRTGLYSLASGTANVILDSAGLRIRAAADSYGTQNALRFFDPNRTLMDFYSIWNSGTDGMINDTFLKVNSTGSLNNLQTSLQMSTDTFSGNTSFILLDAKRGGSSGASIKVNSATGVIFTGPALFAGSGAITLTNSTGNILGAALVGTDIATLGTVTTGTWSATTIAVNKGGTGLTSYAVGDLLYASGSTTLSKLAGVATGNALISGGITTAPSWGKITGAHIDTASTPQFAGIGIGTAAVGGQAITSSGSVNGQYQWRIINTSNGTSAGAQLNMVNDAGNVGAFGLKGSGFTPVGALGANDAFLYSNFNHTFIADSTGYFKFATGGSFTERMRIANDGTVTLSRTGLGTTSTDGLVIQNTTASASQYSPRIRLSGYNPSAQTMDWIIEAQPTGSVQHMLAFSAQTNGGGYTQLFAVFYNGASGNPQFNFNAPSSHNFNLCFQAGGANKWYIRNRGDLSDQMTWMNSDASGNSETLIMTQAGALQLPHYGAGNAVFDASGNITSSSDERMKCRIGSFTRGLDSILQIRPIMHYWNSESKLDPHNPYPGFSAQNVRQLGAIPEAVFEKDGRYSIYERGIVAALVNSVQELNAKILAQDVIIKQLRHELG